MTSQVLGHIVGITIWLHCANGANSSLLPVLFGNMVYQIFSSHVCLGAKRALEGAPIDNCFHFGLGNQILLIRLLHLFLLTTTGL
mmetsp:Transcript_42428/g.40677  ORF Transcript_42428/g.40677 Transcript_42428/m.40677 type:complete len:85 (+) Transcript_42428:154-408(+)